MRARGQAKILLLAVLVFMAVVSLWTPIVEPRIAARWFSLPNFYFLWPVPIVTALTAYLTWRWIEAAARCRRFWRRSRYSCSGFSVWRFQIFLIWFRRHSPFGTLRPCRRARSSCCSARSCCLPIILGYVGFIYWLFRGKVREGESYH